MGTKVRFRLDGNNGTTGDSFSSFSDVSPKKSILKTPVNLTDTVDDLSEGTLSPLAGNGLVASSFTEEIAPVILPTFADSWELSPISGEGSLMDDRLQHLLRNSLLPVFTQHLVPVNKSGSGHHLVFAGDQDTSVNKTLSSGSITTTDPTIGFEHDP